MDAAPAREVGGGDPNPAAAVAELVAILGTLARPASPEVRRAAEARFLAARSSRPEALRDALLGVVGTAGAGPAVKSAAAPGEVRTLAAVLLRTVLHHCSHDAREPYWERILHLALVGAAGGEPLERPAASALCDCLSHIACVRASEGFEWGAFMGALSRCLGTSGSAADRGRKLAALRVLRDAAEAVLAWTGDDREGLSGAIVALFNTADAEEASLAVQAASALVMAASPGRRDDFQPVLELLVLSGRCLALESAGGAAKERAASDALEAIAMVASECGEWFRPAAAETIGTMSALCTARSALRTPLFACGGIPEGVRQMCLEAAVSLCEGAPPVARSLSFPRWCAPMFPNEAPATAPEVLFSALCDLLLREGRDSSLRAAALQAADRAASALGALSCAAPLQIALNAMLFPAAEDATAALAGLQLLAQTAFYIEGDAEDLAPLVDAALSRLERGRTADAAAAALSQMAADLPEPCALRCDALVARLLPLVAASDAARAALAELCGQSFGEAQLERHGAALLRAALPLLEQPRGAADAMRILSSLAWASDGAALEPEAQLLRQGVLSALEACAASGETHHLFAAALEQLCAVCDALPTLLSGADAAAVCRRALEVAVSPGLVRDEGLWPGVRLSVSRLAGTYGAAALAGAPLFLELAAQDLERDPRVSDADAEDAVLVAADDGALEALSPAALDDIGLAADALSPIAHLFPAAQRRRLADAALRLLRSPWPAASDTLLSGVLVLAPGLAAAAAPPERGAAAAALAAEIAALACRPAALDLAGVQLDCVRAVGACLSVAGERSGGNSSAYTICSTGIPPEKGGLEVRLLRAAALWLGATARRLAILRAEAGLAAASGAFDGAAAAEQVAAEAAILEATAELFAAGGWDVARAGAGDGGVAAGECAAAFRMAAAAVEALREELGMA